MFKRKPTAITSEERQKQAIEYITSLDKTEFKKFIDSVELIWQGYDKLLRVQTREEKAEAKEDKETGGAFNLEGIKFEESKEK